MTAPTPQVKQYDLLGRDDEPLTIMGQLLGFATSKRDIHTHPVNFTEDEIIENEIVTQEERLTSYSMRPPTTNPEMLHDAVAELRQYVKDLETAESPVRHASRGDRCSACRWFEVRIFRAHYERVGGNEQGDWDEPSGQYLVVTYGLSSVPGEVAKRRILFTNSPFSVLEMLTQRRNNVAFLPATSARVLSEAAALDDDLADAYVNRAVA
jgi:hypothetical protein